MKIYIEGYGCSLNQADTEAIISLLKSNGFKIYKDFREADIIIINTCAVKVPTELKMLRRIKSLKNECKKAKLIVFGCLSRINPEAVRRIGKEIILVEPKLSKLCEILGIEKVEFSPDMDFEFRNKYIATIPIARGCLGDCTYCCVKNARLKLKSYPIEKIKFGVKKALQNGAKEIRLTAQDLGCYGFDIGKNLIMLLDEILKINGEYRIRLGMMNPYYVLGIKNELVEILRDERVYKFLHLPLQSGSNKILQLMKRNYSAEEFGELVKFFKKKIENISIATDIIVGFPYESEEDFNKSLELIKDIKPDIINVSRYGTRPNTEAQKFEQISEKVKKERSKIMSKLALEISYDNNKNLVGKKERILVVEKGRKGNFIGRASNYKAIAIEKNLLGKFADVKIKKAHKCYLEGEILKQSS